MRWFQRGAAYAAGKGVFLGFENHSDQTQISGNPELCAELCRRVGSAHFGVLYDPCNLMSFGTDYQQALRVFGPHVTHVHLKDGFSVGGAASGGWERCALGQGSIDFVWVLHELAALGCAAAPHDDGRVTL